MSAANRFSAAGPALGYLAQVDYALLMSLRRLDLEDDFTLSIETLDDIVFHSGPGDSATEKWQSKHSIDERQRLTDSSAALWKTIHNWIAGLGDESVRHVLLTTSEARGACAYLVSGGIRNVSAALEALERTARESQSTGNEEYYAAFLALEPTARADFVRTIEIIDLAPSAPAVVDDLKRAVRRSVSTKGRPALVERLRGWWHERVLHHLEKVARGEADVIGAAELEQHLLSIVDELRADNLPIDVLGYPEPSEEDVSEDDRIFVDQLRLMALHSKRLRKCIYDHNRAFAQRSIWQRERLLNIGELAAYDRELVEEWERFFLPLGEEEPERAEEDLQKDARERFQRLETSDLPRIRRDVQAGFVAKGSLHVLADRLEIGWHPDWLSHLRHRLSEVRSSGGEVA